MIAEDFGPVYTRAQKTREGAASAVRHRHDHRHRGQTSETQELFDADKRPGEKCGLGVPAAALVRDEAERVTGPAVCAHVLLSGLLDET